MSPNGAILPQSPGRKPWVNYCNTFIEPLQGRHFQYVRQMPALLVPLLRSSICFCLRFLRVSYRALPSFHPGLCRSAALTGLIVGLFVVSPGFHIGLCPHFTLGFAGVSFLQGSLSDWLCFPRVSYRALPSFHPGLCGGVALAGLFVVLAVFPQGFISGFALILPWALQECRPCRALCRIGCVSPGFHIGLRPHFTLGYAGVSPLQGSLSDWAFAVLCRGIVFVKCVWVCKWIVAFGHVFVFDCDCIVCGIDCCGRAMSPNGAILLQSPGRKPWVNHWNTFIEPLQGRHFLRPLQNAVSSCSSIGWLWRCC